MADGQVAAFSVTVHLPVIARAAPMARDIVRSGLHRCRLDDLVEDVLVVTSELVTSAILAGGDDIYLELHVLDGSVEVAVGTVSGAAADADAAALADGTAGAALVSALASSHGTDAQPGSRHRAWVRFEVPAPS